MGGDSGRVVEEAVVWDLGCDFVSAGWEEEGVDF